MRGYFYCNFSVESQPAQLNVASQKAAAIVIDQAFAVSYPSRAQ
jgi:hypothetical protein